MVLPGGGSWLLSLGWREPGLSPGSLGRWGTRKPLEVVVEVLGDLWVRRPPTLIGEGVCALSYVMFDFFFLPFLVAEVTREKGAPVYCIMHF